MPRFATILQGDLPPPAGGGCSNKRMRLNAASTHQIRLANIDDVAAIFHVRSAVTENVLTLQQLAELGVTPHAVCEIIRSASCIWVAEVNGAVVGFAMVEPDSACLFAAFVLPEHEGRGIGRALVAVCEAALFRGNALAWLETDGRSRAAGFYRHLGWSHAADLDDGDVRLEKRRA